MQKDAGICHRTGSYNVGLTEKKQDTNESEEIVKHTKGKWIKMRRDIVVKEKSGDFRICTMIYHTGTANPESEANARLIAAAPDLLDVCEMLTDSTFRDDDGEWELSRPLEFLKTIADEAIAIAEKGA